MKPDQLTEALEATAQQLGIKIRYEAMTGETAGAAGLCKVHGSWLVLMDRKSTPSERASVLAEALARFDLEKVFMAPEVRRAVDAHRAVSVAGAPASV